jgi:hypothetical protein
VGDERLLKLLEVVKRDLDARDARLEIGGLAPKAAEVVWVPAGDSRRLLAIFDAAPADRDDKVARLARLAEAFSDTTGGGVRGTPPPPPSTRTPPYGALDVELFALAERAGAECAVIVDASSPVLWGASHSDLRAYGDIEQLLTGAEAFDELERLFGGLDRIRSEGVAAALEVLRSERPAYAALFSGLVAQLGNDGASVMRWLRCALAVRLVRATMAEDPTRAPSMRLLERGVAFGVLARGLAGVYALILTFDGAPSEVRAEGAVRPALDHLERRIAALPPIDPSPGGKAMRLRPV